MKILFCGYSDSPLIEFLKTKGEDVIVVEHEIESAFIKDNGINFIITYGYRHMINEDILRILPKRIINLHISYLPWNKGADPNFWSVIDNTPKGVTLHLVDKGLDTGDILIQEKVEITEHETLRTSYSKLQNKIQSIFRENWEEIKYEKIIPQKQSGKGSYHKLKDKNRCNYSGINLLKMVSFPHN